MLCYLVWSYCGTLQVPLIGWMMQTICRFARKETVISHGEALALLFCLLEERLFCGGNLLCEFWITLESCPVCVKAAVQSLISVVCSMQLCSTWHASPVVHGMHM